MERQHTIWARIGLAFGPALVGLCVVALLSNGPARVAGLAGSAVHRRPIPTSARRPS